MIYFEKEEIENFISSLNPFQQQICRILQNIVLDCISNPIEMVVHNALGYAPVKSHMEMVIYIAPQKNWVNLGFFSGADLVDPENLLEGTGKKIRHIKIKTIEDAINPELNNLIRLAWELKVSVV